MVNRPCYSCSIQLQYSTSAWCIISRVHCTVNVMQHLYSNLPVCPLFVMKPWKASWYPVNVNGVRRSSGRVLLVTMLMGDWAFPPQAPATVGQPSGPSHEQRDRTLVMFKNFDPNGYFSICTECIWFTYAVATTCNLGLVAPIWRRDFLDINHFFPLNAMY